MKFSQILLRSIINDVEIGLHPFFDKDSSHGSTIPETTNFITKLPHNIKAYRNHRFVNSNEIQEAMKNAGMTCASNVCTNLEIIPPFINRFNTLEIPVFMEDGAILYNGLNLNLTDSMVDKLLTDTVKTIIIHPMHFVLNTPYWEYMVGIKKNLSRQKWNSLTALDIFKMKYKGSGIATYIQEIVSLIKARNIELTTVGRVMNNKLMLPKTKEYIQSK